MSSFAALLAVGGKSNSLGRAGEVVDTVLADQSRLEELYECLFEPDAWLRMRAADSLEKICRVHPNWVKPYVPRFFNELASSDQPSIQWHLAQMFAEIELSPAERKQAIAWLTQRASDKNVDWIVGANVMKTLAYFANQGWVPLANAISLIEGQQNHHSPSVRKRAAKLLAELTSK